MKPAFGLLLAASFLVGLCSGCSSEAAKDLSEAEPTSNSNSGGVVQTVRVDFSQEVLPILQRSCFPCHGPEMSPASMAGFRVDLEEHAVGRGKIIPGDPDESPLIKRLVTKDNSKRMPPRKSDNPQLDAEQIDLLKRWIREGASFGAPQGQANPQ